MTEVSAQAACAHLSAGLALRAIQQARALAQNPPSMECLRGKGGNSIVAMGRRVKRLRRDKAIVHALVAGSMKSPRIEIVRRAACRDAEVEHRGRAFAVDALHYDATVLYPRERREAEFVLSLTRHAVERFIERGGAGDPRDDLLGKLDAEVLRVLLGDPFVRSLRLDDCDLSFGVPAPHGLWIAGGAVTVLREKVIAGATFATFLGEREMGDDQRAYVAVAEAEGIAAAEARFPSLF
ncbi:hypothetical protein [Alloyangia pacifica]|uniref:Uncharacterized protein n=1 Tax=Alloyangia pacifica TaxID=311180 RepID=A0A1I6PQL7_9RHOB|nr:hypothetical protein [Alloyangia pacifica]SDG33388.1 hypothetical protein SAMN04488245_102402 [Alloyangia pacifica]SFS42522.1 hypothetical protein SAMN04488050_101703 [Alloyangia pacifica]